ncbi:MAG: hypothetical protein NTW91_10330 [Verrucomicrobia bacterium]|nr:hypothetical protein [Verrucomicrobiota bacterium]
MDSAGFGNVPENEQLFRLTWVFITQVIIELGGPVEECDERKVALWQRLLRNCDRGHRVRWLDERAITGDAMPEILKVDYPPGSRMARAGIRSHIAFFNWQDRAKPVGGDRAISGVIQVPPSLICGPESLLTADTPSWSIWRHAALVFSKCTQPEQIFPETDFTNLI